MRGDEAAIQRVQRSGRGGSTDVVMEAMVGKAIERYVRSMFGSAQQLVEKVESLTGDRGDDPAIRLRQIVGLANLPAEPTSRVAAGAAPTKAEHDALVADVHAIFAAVNAVRSQL